jgi:hypothetical protein
MAATSPKANTIIRRSNVTGKQTLRIQRESGVGAHERSTILGAHSCLCVQIIDPRSSVELVCRRDGMAHSDSQHVESRDVCTIEYDRTSDVCCQSSREARLADDVTYMTVLLDCFKCSASMVVPLSCFTSTNHLRAGSVTTAIHTEKNSILSLG